MGDNDNLPFERWTVERCEARIKSIEAGLKNENIDPVMKRHGEHALDLVRALKDRLSLNEAKEDYKACSICGLTLFKSYAGIPPCRERTGMSPEAAKESAKKFADDGCVLAPRNK